MNRTAYKRESAFEKAKRLVNRKLYEMQFKTYPKELRDKLTELHLDPASRYSKNSEDRKEYR